MMPYLIISLYSYSRFYLEKSLLFSSRSITQLLLILILLFLLFCSLSRLFIYVEFLSLIICFSFLVSCSHFQIQKVISSNSILGKLLVFMVQAALNFKRKSLFIYKSIAPSIGLFFIVMLLDLKLICSLISQI